jgi:hypothetical protein
MEQLLAFPLTLGLSGKAATRQGAKAAAGIGPQSWLQGRQTGLMGWMGKGHGQLQL